MPQKWPDVGPRIVKRLKEMGYRSERTKTGADLLRFSLEYSYPLPYMQRWTMDGVTPDRENLLRLLNDLDVSLEWLLLGDGGEDPPPTGAKIKRRPLHPVAGGSDADWRHYVNHLLGWLHTVRGTYDWATI